MSKKLSHRIQQVTPSPTLALSARAAQLRAEGKDIINLSVGEPDFDTPEHIKEAAIKAMAEGKTKYTPVDGIPSLKEAIQTKFKHDNQIDYQLNQILVSCGGKQSIFNLAQALLDPGDEVIIPAPYWVSYPDIVKLAEAKPVIINTDINQQYKIKPEQLAKAITNKTKLFMINSPSNPTGASYTREELSALADVLKQHPDVFIATDDMYEHMTWAKEGFCNILNVCPELYERTITLNGVSKAYSMTGWRIGYAGGPDWLIAAMKKLQSQSTSNPCSIAQAAAEEALRGPQDSIKTMLDAFHRRHDYVYKRFSDIAGVNVIPASGTFYCFPDVSAVIAEMGLDSDMALVEHLINTVGITPVPGSAFGAPGCLRVSFATSDENLHAALDRFEQAIQQK